MGGGIDAATFVPAMPPTPRSGSSAFHAQVSPAPAPARTLSQSSRRVPVPPMAMAYAGAASRSELFPSIITTSSVSGGAPISPAPSDVSESAQPRPRMRDTMVSTSTVVHGAGAGHSSLSADTVLDPFADPAVAGGVKEAERVEKETGANPFADPEPNPNALSPRAAGTQRMSVLSGMSVDVQVSGDLAWDLHVQSDERLTGARVLQPGEAM